MATFASGAKKVGLDPEEDRHIRRLAKEYQGEGYDQHEALKKAVKDMTKKLRDSRKSALQQIQKASPEAIRSEDE